MVMMALMNKGSELFPSQLLLGVKLVARS